VSGLQLSLSWPLEGVPEEPATGGRCEGVRCQGSNCPCPVGAGGSKAVAGGRGEHALPVFVTGDHLGPAGCRALALQLIVTGKGPTLGVIVAGKPRDEDQTGRLVAASAFLRSNKGGRERRSVISCSAGRGPAAERRLRNAN